VNNSIIDYLDDFRNPKGMCRNARESRESRESHECRGRPYHPWLFSRDCVCPG